MQLYALGSVTGLYQHCVRPAKKIAQLMAEHSFLLLFVKLPFEGAVIMTNAQTTAFLYC